MFDDGSAFSVGAYQVLLGSLSGLHNMLPVVDAAGCRSTRYARTGAQQSFRRQYRSVSRLLPLALRLCIEGNLVTILGIPSQSHRWMGGSSATVQCSPCMYADTEHEDLIDEPANDVATATTAAPRQERTPTDVHASADPAAAQAAAVEDEAPAAIQDASDPVASAPPHTNPLQPEPANTPLSSSSPSAESDRCDWHALCILARRRMCFITAVTILTHLSNCMRNHFHPCSSCHVN